MHPDRVPESPATRKLRLFIEANAAKRARAETRIKTRIESAREALLAVLGERGLTPTPRERGLILKCGDAEQLAAWLRRAVTAATVADALAAAPTATASPKPRGARRPAARASR